MAAQICFMINGRRKCIPLQYRIKDRFPWEDPRTGIDLGDALDPTAGALVNESWLESVGLDAVQRKTLVTSLLMSDLTEALPKGVGGQIQAMLKDEISNIKLADGMSLEFGTDRDIGVAAG